MRQKIGLRTRVFLAFMLLFFAVAGYLTYYSGEVYLNALPMVDTIMPEAAGQYENGRMSYIIPKEAVHRKSTNSYYILVVRYVADDFGARYQAAEVTVWVLEELQDNLVRVDGIVWEEPVIVGTGDEIQKWDSIRVE